jgi:hypothetical protein
MRRLGVVAIVAVGLLALSHTLLLALSMVGMFGAQLQGASPGKIVLGVGLSGTAFAVSLLFGAGLIVWRHRLATRWFGDDDVSVGIDALMLLRVGLVLFGVTAAVDSLQWMVFSASQLVLTSAQEHGGAGEGWLGVWYDGLGTVVNQGLRLAIAASLIWWSAPLASFLLRPSAPRRRGEAAGRAACPSCGAAYDPSEYREDADALCAVCHAPLPVAFNRGIARTPSALD